MLGTVLECMLIIYQIKKGGVTLDKSVLKPSIQTYVLFGIGMGFFGGLIFSFTIINMFKLLNIALEDNNIPYLFLVGYVIGIVYLSRYRVYIKNKCIIVPNSVFDLRKSDMKISEIKKIKIDIGVGGSEKKSFYTLRLIGKDKRIEINIKIFSKRDIIYLIHYINQHNQGIVYDEDCDGLLNHDIHPISLAGRRKLFSYFPIFLLFAIAIAIIITVFNL